MYALHCLSTLARNGKRTARESYVIPNNTYKATRGSSYLRYTLGMGTVLFKKFHSPEAH